MASLSFVSGSRTDKSFQIGLVLVVFFAISEFFFAGFHYLNQMRPAQTAVIAPRAMPAALPSAPPSAPPVALTVASPTTALTPATSTISVEDRLRKQADAARESGDTVSALAELGIPLSLDDFGTGYSSLVRLKRLPVEEIKIDSSFVGRLTTSTDDAIIVRSIVDLVRTLGLRSVAEGVEDPQTARMLRDMGCDAAQGWHFGRPMDAATATDWLRRRMERAPEPAA